MIKAALDDWAGPSGPMFDHSPGDAPSLAFSRLFAFHLCWGRLRAAVAGSYRCLEFAGTLSFFGFPLGLPLALISAVTPFFPRCSGAACWALPFCIAMNFRSPPASEHLPATLTRWRRPKAEPCGSTSCPLPSWRMAGRLDEAPSHSPSVGWGGVFFFFFFPFFFFFWGGPVTPGRYAALGGSDGVITASKLELLA